MIKSFFFLILAYVVGMLFGAVWWRQG